MISYQEIDQAIVEKVGSKEGLVTFELKAIGNDAAIFSITAKKDEFSYAPPIRMSATRNADGKVVIKPIPEWLSAYL